MNDVDLKNKLKYLFVPCWLFFHCGLADYSNILLTAYYQLEQYSTVLHVSYWVHASSKSYLWIIYSKFLQCEPLVERKRNLWNAVLLVRMGTPIMQEIRWINQKPLWQNHPYGIMPAIYRKI